MANINRIAVLENGCHEWLGARNRRGYGNINVDGKSLKAHRVAWELYLGTIPDGLCVLHKCDNPPCINPEHLFLGTRQDNIDDMFSKGRGHKAFGAGTNKTKLRDADIERIREACLFGAMQIHIAALYDTTQGTIGKIVRRETWKHVE